MLENTSPAVVTWLWSVEMFFLKRGRVAPLEAFTERLLPACYDEFRGTKIFNIIEHQKPEGDRVFLRVQYAGSAAVKACGARWDPDARRWWYWSGGTAQLAHEHDPEKWLEALADGHNRSVFAEWPIDAEYMRRAKFGGESLEYVFDYRNPAAPSSVLASNARAK